MKNYKQPKQRIEIIVKIDGELFQEISIEGNLHKRYYSDFFKDVPEVAMKICKKIKLEFKDQEACFREKAENNVPFSRIGPFN